MAEGADSAKDRQNQKNREKKRLLAEPSQVDDCEA
jgi:hypothetical protein